jgi:hypothetical protein
MKRSRIQPQSAKRRAAVKANAAAMGEFMSEHNRCSVCHISAFKAYGPDRRIVLHHIAGRGVHCEVPGNWCALCDRCHNHLHSGGKFDDITGDRLPELTNGMILWAKREADGLDEALIASLKNWKALPDHWLPCELPSIFHEERLRNGRQ